ncbi:MAG: hypothetical protein DHS20C18_15440 [Saprospiraceae bacterium]|nr:MAG: hypothetical protein DHS20C18_15440 [Saprospiraceae bacterium]
MKRLFLAFVAIALISGTSFAQEGKKALRTADRDYGLFKGNTQDKEKLSSALENIDIAIQDAEIAAMSKAWESRGKIYDEIATQISIAKGTESLAGLAEGLPKVDNPAIVAFESYKKALELAEKKYETSKALTGIKENQENLYNMGYYENQDGNYEGSFVNFEAVLEAHKILKANDEDSKLASEEDVNRQMHTNGLLAMRANKPEKAKMYFEELYKAGYEEPEIYEELYTIHEKDDRAAAYKYLEQGRKKFPDNVSLLFAEINYFLAEQKLDVLIEKINMAIDKEPNNLSLYTTLGSVYDNLYQKEAEAGNTEKANEYFQKSMEAHNKALAKDENYFDALYSVGALYYNKAAALIVKMNSITGFSKAELKQVEDLKNEAMAEFDKALPFFKRAEKLDPNDVNTLIALKEIFARKDDLETSSEFKKRLENVQGGGTNETSYYK